MPQDDPRQSDRFPRLRPPRDDGNSPRKGPKFNIYWVWAIIFAVLVGFQLFNGMTPDAKVINKLDFYDMLNKGDVDHLVTVPNKNTVRVFIKNDSLEKYKDKLAKNWQGISEKGPHFEFQVIKADDFDKELTDYFAKHTTIKPINNI